MSDQCESFACAHLACRTATNNAVNLGRREFLKETAATAGFAGLILSGCETAPVQESVSPAELLITNARIATLNPRAPTASAIAIRGGVVAAVGTAADVEKLRGPNTQVIDAAGRTIVPGSTTAYALHPRRAHLHQRGALGRRAVARGRAAPRARAGAAHAAAALGAGDRRLDLGTVRGAAFPDARRDQRRHRRHALHDHASLRSRLAEPRGDTRARLEQGHAQHVWRPLSIATPRATLPVW